MPRRDCPEHGDKIDYTCDDCMLPSNHSDGDEDNPGTIPPDNAGEEELA